MTRSPIHSRMRGNCPSQPYSLERVVDGTVMATRPYSEGGAMATPALNAVEKLV